MHERDHLGAIQLVVDEVLQCSKGGNLERGCVRLPASTLRPEEAGPHKESALPTRKFPLVD